VLVEIDGVPYWEHPLSCPEPECSGQLKLRKSMYGLHYRCEHYGRFDCLGGIGAHPDGVPLGIPIQQADKHWRNKAHSAFDQLWKTGDYSRGAAYRWMQDAMGLTKEDAHIARFGVKDCQRLLRLLVLEKGVTPEEKPRRRRRKRR